MNKQVTLHHRTTRYVWCVGVKFTEVTDRGFKRMQRKYGDLRRNGWLASHRRWILLLQHSQPFHCLRVFESVKHSGGIGYRDACLGGDRKLRGYKLNHVNRQHRQCSRSAERAKCNTLAAVSGAGGLTMPFQKSNRRATTTS